MSSGCNLLGVVVSVAQLRTLSYGMKEVVTTWRNLVWVVVCVAMARDIPQTSTANGKGTGI